MDKSTLGRKLARYASLKDEKKRLAEQLKQHEGEISSWEKEIISDMCDMAEAAGLDSISDFSVVIDGRRYGVIRKPFYSIRADDRAGAFEALRSVDLGDLITERVDDRTLTKTMIELAEQNGGELPEKYSIIPMALFDKDSISDRKVGR